MLKVYSRILLSMCHILNTLLSPYFPKRDFIAPTVAGVCHSLSISISSSISSNNLPSSRLSAVFRHFSSFLQCQCQSGITRVGATTAIQIKNNGSASSGYFSIVPTSHVTNGSIINKTRFHRISISSPYKLRESHISRLEFGKKKKGPAVKPALRLSCRG